VIIALSTGFYRKTPISREISLIHTHMQTAAVFISPVVVIAGGPTRNMPSEKVKKTEMYFYF